MKVFILSLIALTMTVSAADKKVTAAKPKTETGKTLDVEKGNTEKDDIVDETPTLTHKNPMKVHVTCKAEGGRELKQGETGYDSCIKKVKEDKNKKTDPKADVEVKFEK